MKITAEQFEAIGRLIEDIAQETSPDGQLQQDIDTVRTGIAADADGAAFIRGDEQSLQNAIGRLLHGRESSHAHGLSTFFARKPGGGKKGTKSASAATTATSAMQPTHIELSKTESLLLNYGIQNLSDLPPAFDLLSKISPRWKAMVDDMFELRAAKEPGLSGESFKIDVQSGGGTYTVATGDRSRKTDLADGMFFRPGDSIFALVHEMTHALPLNSLPPELTSLPYEDLDSGKSASFEQTYYKLLNHLYQDEAISSFAELLLYRDMIAAGVPVDELMSERQPHELEWLKQMNEIYERDGVVGFLQSELYIGRNHRMNYNQARIAQLAFLAAFDPEILNSPGLHAVLQEQGVKVEGADAITKQLDEIKKLIENPSPETIAALIGKLKAHGTKIEFDIPAIINRVREAAALVSGKQQKASASFIGREKEVRAQIGMLAATRQRFESYRQKFETWLKQPKGEDSKDWEDIDGLVSFLGMAHEISRHAEAKSKYKKEIDILIKQAEDFLRARFEPTVAELEIARVKRDEEGVKSALHDIFVQKIGFITVMGRLVDDPALSDQYFTSLARAFRDPFVRKVFNSTRILTLIKLENPDEWSHNEGESIQAYSTDREEYRAFFEYVQNTSNLRDGGMASIIVQILEYFKKAKINIEGKKVKLHEHITARRSLSNAFQIHAALSPDFAEPPVYRFNELHYHDDAFLVGSNHMRPTLVYQQKLRQIRSGEFVHVEQSKKDEFAELYTELNITPTLFWLGEEAWTIPEGVEVFPDNPLMPIPTAIVARNADSLMTHHLMLEIEERKASPFSIDAEMKETILRDHMGVFFGALSMTKSVEEIMKGETGSIWIATRLGIRWARLAAKGGDPQWAQDILNEMSTEINETINEARGSKEIAVLLAGRDAVELERQFIPLWAQETIQGKKDVLKSIIDEYSTTVKLRRSGFKPSDIATLALEYGKNRELHDQVLGLLELAVEHTVTFDLHSPQFQIGVKAVISAIHSVRLLHSDKERLLTRLLEGVIPTREQLKGSTSAIMYKKAQLFDWLRVDLLSEEGLEKIALYPKAEALLFERSHALLQEIGSVYLPPEVESAVLEVAARIARHIGRVHPEIVNEVNLDRLDRVSTDKQYQSDLADVFPSRRVVADQNLPVAQWHTVAIRRGVIDDEVAWGKIKTELEDRLAHAPSPRPSPARGEGESVTSSLTAEGQGEGGRGLDMTSDAEFSKILEVFSAHALHVLEAGVRHGDVDREVTNLFDAYQRRKNKVDDGKETTAASAALSIYTSVTHIMDNIERARLNEITALPPFAWALKMAETAFAAGRPLSPCETAVLGTLLSAPQLSDARRMRELYLAVMADERYPIAIRRQAARGLAYASHAGDAINHLIDSYEGVKNEKDEARFYRTIANYWQRIGALPDDMGVLLIDDGTKEDEQVFWKKFDAILGGENGEELDVITLELKALRHGKFAERFIDEAWHYANKPKSLGTLVFHDELGKIFPKDAAARKKFSSTVESVRLRAAARKEAAEMARMGMPGVFLRQPAEIRRLLYLYIKNMPGVQLQSLLKEMRQMEEERAAKTFSHFFLRTGLAKAGQFLSTMVGMVPDEDRAVFAKLQDRVPPSSITEVKRTIENELGHLLDKIFVTFDKEPVASASIGEVYRARLKDGTWVYVKVSPFTKRAQIETSVETLMNVADAWEKSGEKARGSFDIAGELRRFARQLKQQLDFRYEFRSAASFAYDGYVVPEIVEEMISEHVAVMRPIPGVKVTDLTDPLERRKAADAYAREALKMLSDGEYHADPHPGNVFWDEKTGQLAWLDWGVVGHLKPSGRDKIVKLLTALVARDNAKKMRALEDVATGTDYDRALLQNRMAEIDLIPSPADKLLHLLNIAGHAGLYIQPQVMQALAYLLTVNGVVHDLDPDHDFAKDMMELYSRLIKDGSPSGGKGGSSTPAAGSSDKSLPPVRGGGTILFSENPISESAIDEANIGSYADTGKKMHDVPVTSIEYEDVGDPRPTPSSSKRTHSPSRTHAASGRLYMQNMMRINLMRPATTMPNVTSATRIVK